MVSKGLIRAQLLPDTKFALLTLCPAAGSLVRESAVLALHVTGGLLCRSISDGGEGHEYLDRVVYHFADRMALRFYHLSRGERINSSAADLRGHFPHSALCSGSKDGLTEQTANLLT
jgi:hypothetical protein